MTIESIIEQVYAVEDQRFRAMASNDVEALERLLPDDLHYVHANGAVEGKPEFIRKIASGERRYRRFEAVEREARYEGDFTFVFGEVAVEVDRAAGRLQNTITYTGIYRNTPEPRFFAWHAVKSIAAEAG